MIQTREDLIEYMRCDQIALHCEALKRPRWGRDEIWRFERLLRKLEFYSNNKYNLLHKLYYILYKYRFHKMSVRLGFSIPIHVFDKGLSIAHYGSIVVNHKAKLEKIVEYRRMLRLVQLEGAIWHHKLETMFSSPVEQESLEIYH